MVFDSRYQLVEVTPAETAALLLKMSTRVSYELSHMSAAAEEKARQFVRNPPTIPQAQQNQLRKPTSAEQRFCRIRSAERNPNAVDSLLLPLQSNFSEYHALGAGGRQVKILSASAVRQNLSNVLPSDSAAVDFESTEPLQHS